VLLIYVRKHHQQHPFNSLCSRTTWVSQYQKGKTIPHLMKQEMMGWRWHQLDHMQIIHISLHADNHTSTSSLNFYGSLFLMPNQQCQSTESSHICGIIKSRYAKKH